MAVLLAIRKILSRLGLGSSAAWFGTWAASWLFHLSAQVIGSTVAPYVGTWLVDHEFILLGLAGISALVFELRLSSHPDRAFNFGRLVVSTVVGVSFFAMGLFMLSLLLDFAALLLVRASATAAFLKSQIDELARIFLLIWLAVAIVVAIFKWRDTAALNTLFEAIVEAIKEFIDPVNLIINWLLSLLKK